MPTVENLRYPTATDTPDVPRDIGNLATDVAARTPYSYAMGTVTTPAGGSLAVTFPVGRFTKAPTIAVAVVVSTIPSSVCQAYPGGATATGFTMRSHSTAAVAGGALTVHYIAMQDEA